MGTDIQTAFFDFTIAQMTALNSSPVTVLPALAGHGYWLQHVTLIRNGPRYATQPGAMQLRVPGQAVTYVAFSGSMLLDTTSSATRSAEFRLQSSAGFAGDAATQYGSKGVEYFAATGNPTVDGTNVGGPVIMILRYLSFPTYPETLHTLFAGGGRVGVGRG